MFLYMNFVLRIFIRIYLYKTYLMFVYMLKAHYQIVSHFGVVFLFLLLQFMQMIVLFKLKPTCIQTLCFNSMRAVWKISGFEIDADTLQTVQELNRYSLFVFDSFINLVFFIMKLLQQSNLQQLNVARKSIFSMENLVCVVLCMFFS